MSVAITATAVIMTAAKVVTAAHTVVGIIKQVQDIKKQVLEIRETILSKWKDTGSDSAEFCKRMNELDADIQKVITILDAYEQVLHNSASRMELREQQTKSEAGSLRSPTG